MGRHIPLTTGGDVSLHAVKLGKMYGYRRVLRGVSLSAGQGQVLAIVGPNGSGKSTLIRMLAGLLLPNQGQTWLEGAGQKLTKDERWQNSILVSPTLQPYAHLSFSENLQFISQGRGLLPDIGAIAETVGLGKRKNDLVGNFSSGMIQRTRLAIALATQPRALFLDEPSQFLDESGKQVVTSIVAQQRSRGVTVIATNDSFDTSLADNVFDLRDWVANVAGQAV